MDEGVRPLPTDKILCEGRYVRYVVACMHNCPRRGHCPQFWEFFRAKGIRPVDYSNENGIGEAVMKRVVFDCDRCGKRDIGEPWSALHTSGEAENTPLSAEEFRDLARRAGPLSCGEPFLASVLELLRRDYDWQHFCEPCFKKVAALAGAIVGKPAAKPAQESVSTLSPLAQALQQGARIPIAVQKVEEEPLLQPPAPRPARTRATAR
jgi:hypothetical protein